MAAAECVEVGGGVVAGRGVGFDDVADGSAVGPGPAFGADDVIQGEDGAVVGGGGRLGDGRDPGLVWTLEGQLGVDPAAVASSDDH